MIVTLAAALFSIALDVSEVRTPYARVRIPVAVDPTPGGDYRDLRIRDDRGREIPYVIDPPGTASDVPAIAATGTPIDRPADAPSAQRATIEMRASNVAVTGIRIDSATPSFERAVTIERSDDAASWTPVTTARVWRFRDAPRRLRIPIGAERARYWRVTIEDGDDAPLSRARVVLLVARHEIVFPVERTRRYALTFGDPNLDPPAYDLGERLTHERWRAQRASAGPLVAARHGGAGTGGMRGIPGEHEHDSPAHVVAPVAFAAAVVVLAALAVQLVRSAGPRDASEA